MSLNLSNNRDESNRFKTLIFEDKEAFMDFIKRQKRTQFWLSIHQHETSAYHSSAPVPRKSVLLWVECCLPAKQEFKVRITLSQATVGRERMNVFIHPH